MALIKCPGCGKEIPALEKSCHNCGKPIIDYNSRYHSPTKQPSQHTVTTGQIFKSVAIVIFAIMAYIGISQKNAPGGENNQYVGIICLIVVFALLISLIRNKKKISQTIKAVTPSDFQSAQYYNEILPNGLTIAEQQQIDFNIAQGKYPNGTPYYCGMRIISNTVPASPEYADLNEDEKVFFLAFHDRLIEAKYKPEMIKLTRLSDGTFNVDYIGLCYIGKIRLYKEPETYAVIKKGNKKATKIFCDMRQAKDFASKDPLYEIQVRSHMSSTYMQYSIGITSIKDIYNPSLSQCIDTLQRWIKYLNYCRRN